MRARSPLITVFGVTLLLAMGALALPANSAIAAGNGSSSPTAVAAKHKSKMRRGVRKQLERPVRRPGDVYEAQVHDVRKWARRRAD